MANLFAPPGDFRRRASFTFQPMKPLAQIIRQRQHFLKGLWQRRQILKPMTARAELRPAKRLGGRADAVNSVAFNTIEPSCIRASCYVLAALEELERLLVTGTAHFKRTGRIGFGDETTCVSFELFGLRPVTAVTTIAADGHLSVNARSVQHNELIPTVTFNATVRGT